MCMNIQLDDGVQFGLGVFETICLYKGKPVLLDWHLERIRNSMETLGITQRIEKEEIFSWIEEQYAKRQAAANNAAALEDSELLESEFSALKILISEKNKLLLLRSNPYTKERLQAGFTLDYSPILRNETSPLVYHKTANYGDNILEKRRTHQLSADELLFLNTRGELTEGSTTNLFLVKNGKLLTPPVSSGLLPGILRRFVLEHSDCEERVLYPEDLENAEECFVTNSLMGIMPVNRLKETTFSSRDHAEKLTEIYRMVLNSFVYY